MSIVPLEANLWWQKNNPAGAVLNRLMLLFIFAPIGLVIKEYYALSVVVFAFMVPYGFLMRRLAMKAVRNHLESHPEEIEAFEKQGIISW